MAARPLATRPPAIVLLPLLALLTAGAAGPAAGGGLPELELGHRARIDDRLTVAAAAAAARRAAATAALDTPEARRQAVDALWGDGEPTAVKLAMFDQLWQYVDAKYAAFQGIDVDWPALRDRYRPEVAAGVSRGRFAAIMNQLALALRESHSLVIDLPVNVFTVPDRGVPLVAVGAWTFDPSGACTTAQDDGSALVYAAVPGHPLGLERGDRVLGYDGRPWRELMEELRAEELPLWPLYWGSSPSSFDHSWIMSSVQNWHLFSTMDVVKANGDLVHVSTDPMEPTWIGWCSEQLDVPGVPMPRWWLDEYHSWGVVEGTRIGYIYSWGWLDGAEEAFAEAVYQLTQVERVEGLVLDYRYNFGGYVSASSTGLGLLFPHPEPTLGVDGRRRADDHFAMKQLIPPSSLVMDFAGLSGWRVMESFDGPVAVLTGPGAVSSGDITSYFSAALPWVRTFGKSSAAAVNLPTQPALGTEIDLHPDWVAVIAEGNFYQVGAPHEYLTHRELPVDEPVWLTQQDVAAGRDTVAEAALRWLAQELGGD